MSAEWYKIIHPDGQELLFDKCIINATCLIGIISSLKVLFHTATTCHGDR